MPELYPGAIWRRSEIRHPARDATLGITMHWTVGREAGDITVLDGPRVDCQFYATKDGDVYQFLELNEQGWHGKFHANHYSIGIETEGRGEAWTDVQFKAITALVAWCCKRWDIPVVHADPSGNDLTTFRGIFGHRDLSLGGIRVDGNDHTDTVPDGVGWSKFLAAVRAEMNETDRPKVDFDSLPHDGSMRVVAGGRKWSGWEDCVGPILWLAANKPKSDECAISYRGPDAKKTGVWRGAENVHNVAKNLVATYDLT